MALNETHVIEDKIDWDASLSLPAIHGKENPGIAGAFSGFIGDNLVIAGGANFPNKKPWEVGSEKVWWSTLYYRSSQDSLWHVVDNALPKKIAYGVSIMLPEGLLCIGGCDSERCYDDVFLLTLKNGEVQISTDWPTLPVPLANATGALLDNKIFIAGGQEQMVAAKATSHFFDA